MATGSGRPYIVTKGVGTSPAAQPLSASGGVGAAAWRACAQERPTRADASFVKRTVASAPAAKRFSHAVVLSMRAGRSSTEVARLRSLGVQYALRGLRECGGTSGRNTRRQAAGIEGV